MDEHLAQRNTSGDTRAQIILIVGVILLAINLRPALTAVGPVIGIIRNEIGFSNWSIAMLTSLPLVVFAIMSTVTPQLARKFKNERIIMFGLISLTIGIILRSTSTVILLLFGTLFIGVGIAICNVLIPGIIKQEFPTKLMLMTGVYSTVMGISATSASALSVPIAESLGLGWRISLLIWVIPAIIALIYLSFIIISKSKQSIKNQSVSEKATNIWKSPLAWKIAFFMGCHSLLFYIIISWLPEIFISFGLDKTTSGFLLSYLQLIGIPASLLIPLIANKLKSQAWLVVILNAFLILGLLLLLAYNGKVVYFISSALIGFSINGNFTLALLFLSIRSRDSNQATSLSGMAQTIGYTLAAFGPMIIGLIHDITFEWKIPLLILIFLGLCSSLLGLKVGQNRYVFNQD
ncbi:CynX/NimT family MFS transporter [Oceanobacillus alkalisoli]|uniref:CynX/NimT family MFS transporter n=1 Tax=Oceanobacillus alkalisoli TaxID=2925113 RepID=UPI001EEF7A0F|nr:MFS transporter [Oceanobacillus alkalisoli]MCF3944103.1 MFS transporter [Oceanobacillus alkalisoli]MCG5102510.1 MFS transporter [Oceanobacillus alkalisoli]